MKECVGPDHPTDLVTSSASREGGKKKKKKKAPATLHFLCLRHIDRKEDKLAGRRELGRS